MQNDDNQCNISLLQIIYSAHRYLFSFGNYADNDLVTEQPQYSTHFCFLSSWQNTEILLILNRIRFSDSSFLLVALVCLFHSYRRTFATLQGAAGTDIRTIQSMMAHKSITTTQRYMKVVDSNKREASNKITLKRKE